MVITIMNKMNKNQTVVDAHKNSALSVLTLGYRRAATMDVKHARSLTNILLLFACGAARSGTEDS